MLVLNFTALSESEWTFSTPGNNNLSRDKCELNRANSTIHIERVYDILLLEIYTGPRENRADKPSGLSYIVKSVENNHVYDIRYLGLCMFDIRFDFFGGKLLAHCSNSGRGRNVRSTEISWTFTVRFQHFDVYLRVTYYSRHRKFNLFTSQFHFQ